MIRLPDRTPDYHRNVREHRAGIDPPPCLLCGCARGGAEVGGRVHLYRQDLVLNKAERSSLNEVDYLGCYPVCRECWQRHPALHRYDVG